MNRGGRRSRVAAWPSRWSALLSVPGITLTLSIIGLLISVYLTYVHYDDSVLVCTSGGGCHTVQQSEYATLGPVPIALFGVLMFLTLGALALVRLRDIEFSFVNRETAPLAAWGITLTALLYYAYLVYVELFVLEAICQWCVATTIATIGIFIAESFALRSELAIDEDELID